MIHVFGILKYASKIFGLMESSNVTLGSKVNVKKIL